MNLDWMDELDIDELEKLLDRDTRLVLEYCSMATLKDLLANLHSIKLYISKRPIERMQKYYINKHFNGENHKELAAKLNCSDRFVYQSIEEFKEQRRKNRIEPDLFQKTGSDSTI